MAAGLEGFFAARQLALESSEGLQDMELSLEASFRSGRAKAFRLEGCLERELQFLKAFRLLRRTPLCCGKAFETRSLSTARKALKGWRKRGRSKGQGRRE